MWITFNHLKTNSTKLAPYKLKIRKVIEFFDFRFLMQHQEFDQVLDATSIVCFLRPLSLNVKISQDSATSHGITQETLQNLCYQIKNLSPLT